MAEPDAPTPTPAPIADPTPTPVPADTPGLLNWRSAYLPEADQRDSFFAQFNDVGALAKTAKSQAEMLGRGLFLPREDATPEQRAEAMNKVYDRMGRPKDTASYALPEIALPNEGTFDPQFVQQTKEFAYANGLNQDQYNALLRLSAQTLSDGHNLMEARKVQGEAEGKTALGKRFGGSAQRLQQEALAFWDHFGHGAFGGDEGMAAREVIEAATLPDGTRLIHNPAFVYSLSNAWQTVGEGELFESQLYQPGTSTVATMETRNLELAGKSNDGTITAAERTEWNRLAQQLVNARERDAERGARRRQVA